MHLTSPSLGIFVTAPGTPSRGQEAKWRRSRYVTKSAPANIRQRRHLLERRVSSRGNPFVPHQQRPKSIPASHPANGLSPQSSRISVDDVVTLADYTREVTSLENRRHVMEEAQRAVRHEAGTLDSSRPQSVVGVGLQAITSPMPLSAKDGSRQNQMDHIPALLPLPSDRTFIPSPDHDHQRHMTTPVDDLVYGERSQSVARQCCEIMGPSRCKSCRKLESRLLNREKAEQECPRNRLSQQNISMTQMVKRFYPYMTEAEIHEKIKRGEIARAKVLSGPRRGLQDENESGEESDEGHDDNDDATTKASTVSESESVVKKKKREKETVPSLLSTNPIYLLAKLSMKLRGEPSTPLFFSNLKRMQSKILSGEVERKTYMNKPNYTLSRLKSAVSTISTASSGKSNLSKIGSKLSAEFMPAFVSPRKVKIIEEPKYKVYFGPPLLSKRRQIPNPSFFAGSNEEYSLPERLPDVIEFADSQRINALARAGSAMSFVSNTSEDLFEYDKMSGLEKSGDGRPGSRASRPPSGQEGGGGDSTPRSGAGGTTTPRMMRVSTEGTLSVNVVHEEDENGHEHCAEEVPRPRSEPCDDAEAYVNFLKEIQNKPESAPNGHAQNTEEQSGQDNNAPTQTSTEGNTSQSVSFFVTERDKTSGDLQVTKGEETLPNAGNELQETDSKAVDNESSDVMEDKEKVNNNSEYKDIKNNDVRDNDSSVAHNSNNKTSEGMSKEKAPNNNMSYYDGNITEIGGERSGPDGEESQDSKNPTPIEDSLRNETTKTKTDSPTAENNAGIDNTVPNTMNKSVTQIENDYNVENQNDVDFNQGDDNSDVGEHTVESNSGENENEIQNGHEDDGVLSDEEQYVEAEASVYSDEEEEEEVNQEMEKTRSIYSDDDEEEDDE